MVLADIVLRTKELQSASKRTSLKIARDAFVPSVRKCTVIKGKALHFCQNLTVDALAQYGQKSKFSRCMYFAARTHQIVILEVHFEPNHGLLVVRAAI